MEVIPFKTRCIRVGELDTHAYKLLTIHALTCFMGDVSFLAVVPYGENTFRCGRYISAFGSLSIHATGVVFIQHVKFGFHPLVFLGALEACADGMVSALSYILCILLRNEHHRFREIPSMHDVVDDV
jgi:hypothetical protein